MSSGTRRKPTRLAATGGGCCPFHGEKTPSFHVDDRKGIYHCFGCGAHGDHFRFLTEKAGRAFPDAVEELAREAGVSLPERTPEAEAQAVHRMTLVEANEAAARWYQQQLSTSPAVQEYVAKRGITRAEVGTFRLGFAPDGNALMKANLGDRKTLIEAGILGESEDGRVYDRFRDRLMFPILDKKGQVVAFSGRAMGSGADVAKYLNSPETPIFDKGSMLYNGAAARQAAWDGAQFVLVEGNVDVIAATRAGTAAAAPLGTALTEFHVKLMQKATADAVLCFDGDAAGRKAANRAIDLILPAVSPDFTCRFAVLPDGQDPDSLVRRNPSRFKDTIAAAMPLTDALWARETMGLSTGVPEQRAKLEARLREALGKIVDRPTRRAYGEHFKARLAALGERPRQYRSNSYSQHSTSPGAGRLANGFTRSTGLSLKDAILIASIAAAPRAAMDHVEDLADERRMSPEALELVNKLVGAMMAAPDAAMAEVLEATGLGDLVEEAMAKATGAGMAMAMDAESPAALDVIASMRVH